MGDQGDKGVIARALFMQGYNCSQCVAAAFAEEMGLPREYVMRLVSGFGGGVSRLREVCGAFSGVVFVVGALYGNVEPSGKTATYTIVQEMARKYREAQGSIVCKELLGLSKAEGSPVASARTAEYYKKRPCPDLVEFAANMMEEYIAEHPLH